VRAIRKLSLDTYLAAPHMLVSAIGDAHGVVDARLAEMGHSRRVALTAPNFLLALAQLVDSDLLATLPRHLVARHANRFDLVALPIPLPWTPDPVRIVASKAAMANSGLACLFETLAECFHATLQLVIRKRGTAGSTSKNRARTGRSS
jgi:DNA-binding transcriptional LysR family regulator